jgi:hypothetical protein
MSQVGTAYRIPGEFAPVPSLNRGLAVDGDAVSHLLLPTVLQPAAATLRASMRDHRKEDRGMAKRKRARAVIGIALAGLLLDFSTGVALGGADPEAIQHPSGGVKQPGCRRAAQSRRP